MLLHFVMIFKFNLCGCFRDLQIKTAALDAFIGENTFRSEGTEADDGPGGRERSDCFILRYTQPNWHEQMNVSIETWLYRVPAERRIDTKTYTQCSGGPADGSCTRQYDRT